MTTIRLTPELLRKGFASLDALLPGPVRLVVGGGSAMLLAYGVPVRTTDVDAYALGVGFEELVPFVQRVARDVGLPSDWLNPWFQTFVHVLPADYGSRLVDVYVGERLRVQALGAEDLLLMKCFAGREKDVGHARLLARRARDLSVVERRLAELIEKRVPRAQDAADFFDELVDEATT